MDLLHHCVDSSSCSSSEKDDNIVLSNVSTKEATRPQTVGTENPGQQPTARKNELHLNSTVEGDDITNRRIYRRRRRRNVTIVTEAKFALMNPFKEQSPLRSDTHNQSNLHCKNNNATPNRKSSAITSGRWSTHCSCMIELSRQEQKYAWKSIRATCRMIERQYPQYVGYCIPMFDVPRRKHPPTQPHDTTKTNGSVPRKRTRTAAVARTSSIPTTSSKMSSPVIPKLHISLTRPDIALHTNNIDAFLRLLAKELHTVVACVKPFHVQFIRNRHSIGCIGDHGTSTMTSRRIPLFELLHNEQKTKSYGIWRCCCIPSGGGGSGVTQLQQLSHACDTVLTQYYHQLPYQYSVSSSSSSSSNVTVVPPIFHVSLVRFEPAIIEFTAAMQETNKNSSSMNNSRCYTSDPKTAEEDQVNDPNDGDIYGTDDDDETSSDSWSSGKCGDDDDDDTSSEDLTVSDDETMSIGGNHRHSITHVTCQFGGSSKIYNIPLL
jgi:hypothetical protein